MSLDLQIDPIKHEKVQDKIYSFLRYRIINGALQPGQPLKLMELAERFGTSAMPVREALNRLIAERALANEPNRSVIVPTLTRERLQDLRLVRKTVETAAVRLATERITAAQVAELHEMVDQQFALEDADASVEANTRFHFTIYRLSGSEILIPIIESLWLQFGPYLHYARRVHGEAREQALQFHRALVEAFAGRDQTAAAAVLEQDVDMSFELAMGAAATVERPPEGKSRKNLFV